MEPEAFGKVLNPLHTPPLDLKVLQVLQVFIAEQVYKLDLPAQFPSLLSEEQAYLYI